MQLTGDVNLKLTAQSALHTRSVMWGSDRRPLCTCSQPVKVPNLSASSPSVVFMHMPAMANLYPQMLDFYINRDQKLLQLYGKTGLTSHGRYCMYSGWWLIVTSSLHATEGMLQSVYCQLLLAGVARLVWSGRV